MSELERIRLLQEIGEAFKNLSLSDSSQPSFSKELGNDIISNKYSYDYSDLKYFLPRILDFAISGNLSKELQKDWVSNLVELLDVKCIEFPDDNLRKEVQAERFANYTLSQARVIENWIRYIKNLNVVSLQLQQVDGAISYWNEYKRV
jgi:hypothetical protein